MSASYNAKDGAVYLNVLNRSKEKDISTRVESQEGQIQSQVAVWEMNGTNVIGAASLGNPGPDWHVMGTGDYNGQGRSDIQQELRRAQRRWRWGAAVRARPRRLGISANLLVPTGCRPSRR